MTPTEILYEAEDKATHYPGDRLRITGEEVLALVRSVRADALRDAAQVVLRREWNLPEDLAASIRSLRP